MRQMLLPHTQQSKVTVINFVTTTHNHLIRPACQHNPKRFMSSTSSSTPKRKQRRLPAAYYRGGTSRAVIFKTQDLPPEREQWASLFRGVIGSPDPAYGRQLDGMGGGISSLSKVCVVGPSSIGEAADVDYTFAAVGVRDDEVDYSSNCGNMSAAIGPFAVDSGLVTPRLQPQFEGDGERCEVAAAAAVVRIHNTNTGKIIRSTFPVVVGEVEEEGGGGGGGDGSIEATADGDFAIDGVAGTGAPVRLDFLHPAGSKTGKLLPTGERAERFETEAARGTWTCIDAGNPCVFIRAEEVLKKKGGPVSDFSNMTPQEMEQDRDLMDTLDSIRRTAGVKMGLGATMQDIPGSIPKIAMVWAPGPGETGDICVRALSVGQPHKAVPVTVALALAAAAQLPGTVVHDCVAVGRDGHVDGVEIRHPTGSITVDAKYDPAGNLQSAAVYRTARRLMEGTIYWK